MRRESTFSRKSPLNTNRAFKVKNAVFNITAVFWMELPTLGLVQTWGFRDEAQRKQVAYL